MKEQLRETWQIHHRMNELLINNTSDAGMLKTLSTKGGRTIFLQWVHIHNVRMQWLEITAKDIFQKYKPLDKNIDFDRTTLLTSLKESASGIEELLSRSWDDGGKVKGFKKGLIPMLGYFVAHESHHRGNIMLTLKLSAEKIPDSVKWGLWEWGK